MTKNEYHKALEAAGHQLFRDEDGEVDSFRLDDDVRHNGPECMVCGESWCEHCQDKIEPCDPDAAERMRLKIDKERVRQAINLLKERELISAEEAAGMLKKSQ